MNELTRLHYSSAKTTVKMFLQRYAVYLAVANMSEKIRTCWCELQNEMKAFRRHVRVEPLSSRKKDSLYRKNVSGRGWQVGTRDRVPYNNSGNREKPFLRHWSFKQQHHR